MHYPCRSMRAKTGARGLKRWVVQVAARRAAVRARLSGRSWAGIISRMYRSGVESVLPVLVFGPRLNSKSIDKPHGGKRVREQKTWNRCTLSLRARCESLFLSWKLAANVTRVDDW